MELLEDNPGAEGTPVDEALDQLSTALGHLVKLVEDGGLAGYDFAGLVGFAQGFERFRNRLSLVDHRVVVDGAACGLPEALVQPSMRRVLTHVLRVSAGEAARRVLAAEACTERVSMLGEVVPPVRPVLAAAQREGAVSSEQVAIIERALGRVDRAGFDPEDVAAGERLLTSFAVTFGCKDLKDLADRTVEAIDPDGTLPREELNLDRRHFSMRQCRDGMYAGEFRLTGGVGAKLSALLQPLARPHLHPTTKSAGSAYDPTAGGASNDSTAEVDGRTYGQRMHDAVEEVCDRVLRSGDVVGVGGVPASVIVTVRLDDLRERSGFGQTSDGTLLSTSEVLRVAGEAEVVPAVMTGAGRVLHLGRSRRIASHSQTLALVARDGGCSFPACGRAPEWCERHHIVEWVEGGRTDLDNLTLLCSYHHRHFAGRGWTCKINPDGLPEWRPPRWLDREQKPLVNSRIIAQQAPATRRDNRPRRESPEPTRGGFRSTVTPAQGP